MAYIDWQTLTAPAWLQGPNGTGYVKAFASAKDDLLDRARLGVLARFPGVILREVGQPPSEAPTDALDHTGADRILPRAPSENDGLYAERLLSAWDDGALLGGPLELLEALSTMGYAGANIIQDNGRYWYLSGTALTAGTLMTMSTRGRPGWMFDGIHDVDGALWNRFALLFTADAANLSGTAGQAILNGIVSRWRPAISTFMGSYVLLAGNLWGWPTTQTWGAVGATWGGGSVRFIPPDGSPAVVTGP
jgi:hypothetical protein